MTGLSSGGLEDRHVPIHHKTGVLVSSFLIIKLSACLTHTWPNMTSWEFTNVSVARGLGVTYAKVLDR